MSELHYFKLKYEPAGGHQAVKVLMVTPATGTGIQGLRFDCTRIWWYKIHIIYELREVVQKKEIVLVVFYF